jgi:hypothetical protein
MKKLYFFGLLSSLFIIEAYSQGCVPVRSTGSSVIERPSTSKKKQTPQWTFSATNRYFKSFRHFVGDAEQKQRADAGTEVINKSYTLDLSAVRYLNRRWSVSMNLPLIANTRSSLYEHGNVERHSTESYGLGDIRLTAYRWMLDPKKFKKANLQAGLGVKLPTGNYQYDDYFYTGVNGGKVLGPVDQSIQPGDGGVGIIAEMNNFYNLNRRLGLYSNLLYLVNPRETNGVSTARGRTPTPASIAYGSDVMSVPDQYMARLGANFSARKFIFSAGVRIDGVPAKDLVGGNNGFRRPGYIVSAEPGVTYRTKRISTFLTAPIAFERNRIQSVPDKIRSEITKTYYKGDAAFADYVVNLGVAFNLFKKVKTPARTESQIIKPYYNKSYRDAQCPKSRSNCQSRIMKL